MRVLTIFTAAFMANAAPSLAQMIEADPDQISAAVQRSGYPVERTTDGEGDPKLRVTSEGTTFSIYFYGCNSDHFDCASVTMQIGFDMSNGMDMSEMVAWNATKRFAFVWLDNEDDPFLQMDINLDGGISEANFTNSLEIWRGQLSEFKDYIDW